MKFIRFFSANLILFLALSIITPIFSVKADALPPSHRALPPSLVDFKNMEIAKDYILFSPWGNPERPWGEYTTFVLLNDGVENLGWESHGTNFYGFWGIKKEFVTEIRLEEKDYLQGGAEKSYYKIRTDSKAWDTAIRSNIDIPVGSNLIGTVPIQSKIQRTDLIVEFTGIDEETGELMLKYTGPIERTSFDGEAKTFENGLKIEQTLPNELIMMVTKLENENTLLKEQIESISTEQTDEKPEESKGGNLVDNQIQPLDPMEEPQEREISRTATLLTGGLLGYITGTITSGVSFLLIPVLLGFFALF